MRGKLRNPYAYGAEAAGCDAPENVFADIYKDIFIGAEKWPHVDVRANRVALLDLHVIEHGGFEGFAM